MSDLQVNQGPKIVALTIAFLAVPWTAVILRIYIRVWVKKAIGADDWLIIVGLVSNYPPLISLIYL